MNYLNDLLVLKILADNAQFTNGLIDKSFKHNLKHMAYK